MEKEYQFEICDVKDLPKDYIPITEESIKHPESLNLVDRYIRKTRVTQEEYEIIRRHQK